VVGPWGGALINLAVVVSVLGAFLSWTLLAAEIPMMAARDGTMPKLLATENDKGSPSVSLWLTNGLVQLFLIITYFANSTYQALFLIASAAILVPYVLSGAYALKIALTRDGYGAGETTGRDIFTGAVATIYGAWLVYAAGPTFLFMCAMPYAPGILVYIWARREQDKRVFTPLEVVLALAIVTAGGLAAYLI
ncbi:amino acid permease, partial [Asanoa iriomotensis]|uniref:amino acid permease n=1 Tax=Asanoa iriomotensis TaxID=234613 RepID=UPI0031D4935D